MSLGIVIGWIRSQRHTDANSFWTSKGLWELASRESAIHLDNLPQVELDYAPVRASNAWGAAADAQWKRDTEKLEEQERVDRWNFKARTRIENERQNHYIPLILMNQSMEKYYDRGLATPVDHSVKYRTLFIWNSGLALALSSAVAITVIRRARRRRAGLCEECGYDLRASSMCCPECGKAIPSTPQAKTSRAA